MPPPNYDPRTTPALIAMLIAVAALAAVLVIYFPEVGRWLPVPAMP